MKFLVLILLAACNNEVSPPVELADAGAVTSYVGETDTAELGAASLYVGGCTLNHLTNDGGILLFDCANGSCPCVVTPEHVGTASASIAGNTLTVNWTVRHFVYDSDADVPSVRSFVGIHR